MDAAQEGYFRQGKAQNFLDPEHIEKIVVAYRGFEDVERFAHVADLAEIEANDFNLNIAATWTPASRSKCSASKRRWRNCGRPNGAAMRRWRRWTSAELGYER